MTKYYILFLISFLFLISCSDDITDSKKADKAPDTFLFLYPNQDADLNQQKSRLSVHWWSDDSDGLVVGYLFKWEGIDTQWHFTTSNDSTFSLPIGSVDTNYVFKVSAIDNMGNGVYDAHVIFNNVDIGGEPFIDANNDGIYTSGEKYTDWGNIDPTPAELKFPIKNTSPVIGWNKVTVLPATSYPVITVGWDASDLDGDESIVGINISLNDTTDFITLPGNARLVTLRCKNFEESAPKMEVLLNGSESSIQSEKLSGLLLNNNNRIYIQAVDISGSKSNFVFLPDSTSSWYVKKPKGKLLLIDDYTGTNAESFYSTTFNNLRGGQLVDKYDEFNVETTKLPYQSITFLETMKLFKYIYWYTDTSPTMDLAAIATQKFIQAGGKIAFSMNFQDSSDTFPFDKSYLQNFLAIDSLGQKRPLSFLLAGASLLPSSGISGYPTLKTSVTISWVRTYSPNVSSAYKVYDVSSSQINGNIAFMDRTKTLFFIGLPLHLCDGNPGTVSQLIEKIFFDEFGYSL
ncbi:MAG: hypothetical protein V1773_08485 [bacterium]